MSTSSIKRRIGNFPVVVVQWTREKNALELRVMHVQSCCFAHKTNCLLIFLRC